MTTDLYHLDFFLVFIYLYLLETLIFWTKCFLATPYFKAFSLSPRGLPIPLFPTEDQRNLAHTSLSLGTKLSLPRHLPRGCSLGPAKDAPGPCYIAPFCKKKKRGMSVPFYRLADIDHAISKTRYNTYICILFYSKWTDCKL